MSALAKAKFFDVCNNTPMTVIHIGSKNQTKIQAAKNIILSNDLFRGAEIVGSDVDVEEFGHPKTIEETIMGAKQRAKAAFKECVLSVGIESGLIVAPQTKAGYLETTACALYDGEQFAIGMAPAFEWPPKVTKMILDGLDGSQAFKATGLTEHEKIGAAEGAIHVLTHGKINRTKLNELAITMALLQFENPDNY